MLAMGANLGWLIEAHSQSSLSDRLLPRSGATLRHVCSSSISRLRCLRRHTLGYGLGSHFGGLVGPGVSVESRSRKVVVFAPGESRMWEKSTLVH
jgi:hypothetical protein